MFTHPHGFMKPAGADSGPAFYAITPDAANEMTGVLNGIGSMSVAHDEVVYAPDFEGVWQKFPADSIVWALGRAVLSGGAGTDVVSYWNDDAPSGDPLSEVPYAQLYPAATNSQIQSNDLTNVEWTAPTMAVAQNETGITGEANKACTLTATAANATVLANAITSASNDQATCWYIKRKTGEGNIELTVDGGTTWQTVTLTASFQKFTVDQAAVTDPQIGLRIVTDTDAVIVGNAECYLGVIDEVALGYGPTFTTTVAASTDSTLLRFDVGNWDDDSSCWYMEIELSTSNANNSGWSGWFTPSAGLPYGPAYTGVNLTRIRSYDGSNILDKDNAVNAAGTYQLGANYNSTSAQKSINVDGSWSSTGSYDGAFDDQTNDFINLASGSTPSAVAMRFREMRRYDTEDYADGTSIIDGLMP